MNHFVAPIFSDNPSLYFQIEYLKSFTIIGAVECDIIHVTDHCDVHCHCQLEQKPTDDQCSTTQSLERSSHDVQLTKSFYSDSVISVFSYTTRFHLFL